MALADNLRKLRKEKGMTQDELASKIFVSRSLIAKFETGSAYPTNDCIEKLASALDVDKDTLVSDNLLAEECDPTSVPGKSKKTEERSVVGLCADCFVGIFSLAYAIMVFVPVFGGYRYQYPIPDGQSQPDRVFYQTSIWEANLSNGNPVAAIAFALSLVCLGLSIVSFFPRKGKVWTWARLSNYLLFITAFVLALLSFVFGLSYAGSYLD